jgi:hypothetical protein
MVRKLILMVIAIGLVFSSNFVWSENYDFRHTRWGMAQKEVIGSEEKMDPVEKTENLLRYKAQILGKNVELLYIFVQDMLVGSAYKLDDNYLNSHHFIGTYNKFKEALTRKYGQPDKDATTWLKDTYKYDPSKWGLALSLGHTEYAASWNTQQTAIECSLREQNYYVLCLVKYWSTQHWSLSNDFRKAEKPEDVQLTEVIDPF